MGGSSAICAKRAQRRGRGGIWLLAVMALLVGFYWASRQGSQDNVAGALRPGPGTQETPRRGSQPQIPRGQASRSTLPGKRSLPDPATRFSGRGSLRGLLTTRDGSPPPLPYILHVGPSGTVEGREYARPRSVEMNAAEFELKDLPLGGYDVWVKAPGMNSRRSAVLLTQSARNPYIIIKVSPMGYLDGYVLNQDGRPAQDLRVELAEALGKERRLTKTRGDGFYRFGDVHDGEFQLLFGPADRPLLPARDLLFAAPSMHFPKVVLPLAVDVEIRTTDVTGQPLGDVTVSGYARPTGRIQMVTDASGRGWARNLPPGHYRVSLRNEQGLTAKSTFIVTDQADQEFWIAVK